jgi:DtxR family Mn-dependent transcriptional regulator
MKKGHLRDLADHDIEHVAAELWQLEEDGPARVDDLRSKMRVDDIDATLEGLVGRELLGIDGSRASLTPAGRKLAQRVMRRHRLAELLFSTVLDIQDDHTVHHTACVMEHVLSHEVTDSVCSFLGHPKFCPHGKPIPAGRCCRSFSNNVEPLVQPLNRLAVGESARIAYIVPKDPDRLVRLSNLGIVPGATVRLRQRKPAAVISIGETTLAVDRDIAEEVYVKKVSD